MTRKKALSLLMCVAGVFLIINAVWFAGIGYSYMRYEEGMDKCLIEGSTIKYRSEDNDFVYEIKPAAYLSFSSGFLRVSEKYVDQVLVDNSGDATVVYRIDENGNEVIMNDYHRIDFYYWTKPFGNSEYGIMYWSADLDAQILFDRNLQVINGNDIGYKEDFQKIVDREEKQILNMMQRAKEKWGLEI